MQLWYNISVENCAPAQPGRFCFKAIFVAPASLSALLSKQAIPKLNSKETSMSSLSAKDRVSLCSFTFSDGRRCRTPRISSHPHFCFYHAQKEARAQAADTLGKDLAYFFSGDYLSACDLSTALARLIPAVLRGDVKPKTAHTVAYLVQTLMQAIHLSKHEYINAFGSDGWRQSIRNSVNGNHDYLFPPDPEPEQPEPPQPHPAETPVNPSHSPLVSPDPVGATSDSFTPSEAEGPLPHAPQPAPSPHASLPPTSAEFVQQVVARLQTGGAQAPQPAPTQTCSPIPTQATPTPALAPSPTSADSPQTPASPSQPACHPERSEGSHLNHPASAADKTQPPVTQSAVPVAPTPQSNNPPQTRPSTGPTRDAPWLHFGDTRHIPPDSHLL